MERRASPPGQWMPARGRAMTPGAPLSVFHQNRGAHPGRLSSKVGFDAIVKVGIFFESSELPAPTTAQKPRTAVTPSARLHRS